MSSTVPFFTDELVSCFVDETLTCSIDEHGFSNDLNVIGLLNLYACELFTALHFFVVVVVSVLFFRYNDGILTPDVAVRRCLLNKSDSPHFVGRSVFIILAFSFSAVEWKIVCGVDSDGSKDENDEMSVRESESFEPSLSSTLRFLVNSLL